MSRHLLERALTTCPASRGSAEICPESCFGAGSWLSALPASDGSSGASGESSGRTPGPGECGPAAQRKSEHGTSEKCGKAGRNRAQFAENSSRLIYPHERGHGAVPVTVTDPMNRLVTGLEQDDFQVFENTRSRRSGPLPAKTRRFRSALSSTFRLHDVKADPGTGVDPAIHQDRQPQDEFFVIGFNDRPELIEDLRIRWKISRRGWRRCGRAQDGAAGRDLLRRGKDEGRTPRAQGAAGGLRRWRQPLALHRGGSSGAGARADVEIYSIGIFDPYAPHPRSAPGPNCWTM